MEGANSGDGGQSFRSEQAAILGLYSAMIELTRRSVPAREVAAAVRALMEAQQAAIRAVTERQKNILVVARETRHAASGAVREGVHKADGVFDRWQMAKRCQFVCLG